GGTVVFYIDGVARPAASYNPAFTFSTQAFIGGIGNNYNFYGTVDELAFYNRPLSAAEIQSIYGADGAGKCTTTNPACAAPPSGLVSWWRAEGNSLDQAGSNNGTLVGNTTFGP